MLGVAAVRQTQSTMMEEILVHESLGMISVVFLPAA